MSAGKIGGMQKWAWPALGLFVLACFWGFWWYGPFDLDEGLYAVALMEMQERGDWVMPSYRGEPFWEKPILVFWTAWIADLFGANGVVALRLPSILATLGTLTLVGLFTKRIRAVMILSVSVLSIGVGRMFIPDPLLIFGMTAALFSFWKAREDPRWHLAAGAALAIAVLAKGPVPLVIFGLLGIYARWRIGGWPRAAWWRIGAIALFLAAVLPWYIAAAQRSPEFIQEFIIKQNFGRLTGEGDPMHAGQIWMYIPVVIVGLLPFSLSLIGTWRNREGQLEQYLWAYVWIVFVLFSFSGAKLPHYILPIFPTLAVLIDRYLERTKERVRWEYAILMLLLTISLFVYGLFLNDDGSILGGAVKMGYYTSLLGFLGAAALCYFKRGGPQGQGFAAYAPVALVTLLLAQFLYWGQTHANPTKAAVLADAQGIPVVEYRTGGERESGRTSHPSIQWWIGKTTLTAENLTDLRGLIRREGSIVVIARDGRYRTDEQESAVAVGLVTPIENFGDWEVLRIDAAP